MFTKLPFLFSLLLIGSSALVLASVIDMAEGLKWALLIIAVTFNITSGVGLMVVGLRETKRART